MRYMTWAVKHNSVKAYSRSTFSDLFNRLDVEIMIQLFKML